MSSASPFAPDLIAATPSSASPTTRANPPCPTSNLATSSSPSTALPPPAPPWDKSGPSSEVPRPNPHPHPRTPKQALHCRCPRPPLPSPDSGESDKKPTPQSPPQKLTGLKAAAFSPKILLRRTPIALSPAIPALTLASFPGRGSRSPAPCRPSPQSPPALLRSARNVHPSVFPPRNSLTATSPPPQSLAPSDNAPSTPSRTHTQTLRPSPRSTTATGTSLPAAPTHLPSDARRSNTRPASADTAASIPPFPHTGPSGLPHRTRLPPRHQICRTS